METYKTAFDHERKTVLIYQEVWWHVSQKLRQWGKACGPNIFMNSTPTFSVCGYNAYVQKEAPGHLDITSAFKTENRKVIGTGQNRAARQVLPFKMPSWKPHLSNWHSEFYLIPYLQQSTRGLINIVTLLSEQSCASLPVSRVLRWHAMTYTRM